MQWLRRGHTDQDAARAFGRRCLARQGAIERTLSRTDVQTRLATHVTSDGWLASLEPVDMHLFCPAYGQLGRRDRSLVWQAMLLKMSEQESRFRAALPYWEVKQNQYSIGLLQLSLSDERKYHCGFTSEVDITDPDRNLACGAKIMATLVVRDGRLGGDEQHKRLGAAAYWSSLQAKGTQQGTTHRAPPRNSRRDILNEVKRLRVCSVD